MAAFPGREEGETGGAGEGKGDVKLNHDPTAFPLASAARLLYF